MRALGIHRITGHDIDRAQKGTRTIGRRVRAAMHLDALDVLQRHGLQARARAALHIDRVDRAAVHHHLHVIGIVAQAGVVAALGRVAFKGVADAKTRHQAQQVGHITRAAHADDLPIDDGDRPRCFVQPLRQPRYRQDHRYIVQVVFSETAPACWAAAKPASPHRADR